MWRRSRPRAGRAAASAHLFNRLQN